MPTCSAKTSGIAGGPARGCRPFREPLTDAIGKLANVADRQLALLQQAATVQQPVTIHRPVSEQVDRPIVQARRDPPAALVEQPDVNIGPSLLFSDGAKSILVLEQNDIQLTNVNIVTDTYLPLAQARVDRPDETYLVASCTGPPAWWMWPILIGDRSYYDIVRTDEPSYWEFDPDKLVAVTSR